MEAQNCKTSTCKSYTSSGNGFVIVLVIYILLAIILGSYFVF